MLVLLLACSTALAQDPGARVAVDPWQAATGLLLLINLGFGVDKALQRFGSRGKVVDRLNEVVFGKAGGGVGPGLAGDVWGKDYGGEGGGIKGRVADMKRDHDDRAKNEAALLELAALLRQQIKGGSDGTG